MEVIMSISKHANKKKNILIAASEIVKEEGVVKLTLEAVAQRAGVSKGGLLYHFPSKEALIKGMVEDWINNYFECINTLVNNDDDNAIGKWNRAYLKSTFSDLENNNLNSALMAAMFINPDLLDEFRQRYDILHTKLITDGIDPVKITITRLSIDGLWFSEIFGMAPLNEELKTQVFDELINMIQEDE
ncbi:TPA: TetR family transcriptional regulator [Listeria monocytogenes]|uniref:TetR/AcrR family transcriptional regulator n=2 Tax=Bacilli TaxID=91061 RepID=A0A7C0EEQ3_LISMN|nr:TetR/AcrR family transcriptional regulator [Listeria monocytogenes]NEL01757.1 TetR/AcrR family transcriptional regulator [Bacillus mobilis]PGT77602.1 TetR/AcrR family transcriptional regulator [Bacillus sp. AFS040349]RGB21700.1 transcriptional regulator [Rhizophagus diaphanus] [Rhizophagus sp. MUCL 43196]HBM3436196.1 TetR family transcriptional regulator [Listeria innocua]EAA0320729.1 TetR/AcrR family transcriptional regulator [Listeria monocytogenes]